jgi:hypothetical protein
MDAVWTWLAVASSVALIFGYELRLMHAERRDPAASARAAHSLMRTEWVNALSRKAGTEILAVQALRNSLMSATITASTAALVLMGSVSLIAAQADAVGFWLGAHPFTPRLALEFALSLDLFAAFVCAAMSMRFYHHATFIMSMPIGSPERSALEDAAIIYVRRAGILYSWSLRCFLFTAPLVVGLLSPLFMPVAVVVLIWVLRGFDRVPSPLRTPPPT